jgi:cation:H+ antiporter
MTTIAFACFLIIIGVCGLSWGAHHVVDKSLALAQRLGASIWGVGIVIVGFATSFPEMVVSALSAIHGNPQVGIGNAVGSNITNIGLVVGMIALIAPQIVSPMIHKRELPLLLAIIVSTWLLLCSGHLGLWQGILLLIGMLALLLLMAYWANRERAPPVNMEIDGSNSLPRLILWLITSLAVLTIASEALLRGAIDLAHMVGVNDLVIGITLIAFGTSMPELAASLAGAYQKSPEIAVGNIIGSNMFNLLAVLAMPAIFHPGPISHWLLYRDYPMMAVTTLVMYFLSSDNELAWPQGLLLLLLFAGYTFSLYYFDMPPPFAPH